MAGQKAAAMTHPQLGPGGIELSVGYTRCDCSLNCQHPIISWCDIGHADPVIECTVLALNDALDQGIVTLSGEPFRVQRIGEQGLGMVGMVTVLGEFVTFTGRNRTLIYRLIDYDFAREILTMAWPD